MKTTNLQKYDLLRLKLLICCFSTKKENSNNAQKNVDFFEKTPTTQEVIAICNNFRIKLLSFILNKKERDIILKLIDDQSKICQLIKSNNLLSLCKNKGWKKLLNKYGEIFPKAEYLKEICLTNLN